MDCPKCGGMMIYIDSDWQGEDENQVGHTEVLYQCEDCGTCDTFVLSGG